MGKRTHRWRLAGGLDVNVTRINDIARSRCRITVDAALPLARHYNTSHQFWINLHTSYDVEGARRAAGRAIELIRSRKTKGHAAPTYRGARECGNDFQA